MVKAARFPIAARAALRVAPLATDVRGAKLIQSLTSAVFRAAALARVAVAADARAGAFAAAAGDAAHAAAASRTQAAMWKAVQADAVAALTFEAAVLVDLSLWPDETPDWARQTKANLAIDLPGDGNWEVWIDWYEQRLRGGSRGEEYELVFASVPQEEWDKGPAAVNTWIKDHLPEENGVAHIKDALDEQKALEIQLGAQSPGAAIAIAARATARMLPLLVDQSRGRYTTPEAFPRRMAAICRVISIARVVSIYPSHERSLAEAADAAAGAVGVNIVAELADACRSVVGPATARAMAARAIESVSRHFLLGAQGSTFDTRSEVHADQQLMLRLGVTRASLMPLWRNSSPNWLGDAWVTLRRNLPACEDWDVWIDWYEERLRGGSRGEAYELIFASVPKEEWDKGSAAANAWIKAHLANAAEPARPVELPAPPSNLDAPFAYGWTASQRVAVVAGAQNLPFYSHFSREEDHRRALEACRVGGERLLKALRDRRYNARPEYGEALEYSR
jgi:hypothetical protein